jgi:hypothetical protein
MMARPRKGFCQASITQGDSASKNAINFPSRNCFPTTTFSCVDALDLNRVLGDIQTDRGNLHLDGSPHVIRHGDHHFDAGRGAVHRIKTGPEHVQ